MNKDKDNISLRAKINAIVIIFRAFGERLRQHNVFLVAGGIAFNLLLYSLPLMLVVIFIVDKIFQVENITPFINRITNEFLPPNPAIDRYLTSILDEITKISEHSSLTGVIGIVAMLWFASMLVSAIRRSLNTVLELKPKHFVLIYRLKDIVLTVILTVLVFIMLYALPLFTFATEFITAYIPDFLSEIVSFSIVSLSTVTFSFFVFLVLYSWVPNQKVPLYFKISGSLLSAGAIEAGRHIFSWYISGFSNLGRIYGTFAVLASMVIWLYYFSVIILLSAEVVKFIHDLKYADKIVLPQKGNKKKQQLLD